MNSKHFVLLCVIIMLLMACTLPKWGERQTTTIVVNDPTVNALETAIAPKATSTLPAIQPSTTSLPPTEMPMATVGGIATADTTATPHTTATPAPAACLAGTWQITNLEDYILAAIPPEMIQEYQPTYKSTSGQAYVTFTDDGNVSIQASQLKVLFNIKAAVFSVELPVQVDGTAKGLYQADASQITTSNMDTSGMKASAKAFGQSIVEEAQIINAIPLVQTPFNTATYQCSQQALALRLTAYPESIPPLNFQRLP